MARSFRRCVRLVEGPPHYRWNSQGVLMGRLALWLFVLVLSAATAVGRAELSPVVSSQAQSPTSPRPLPNNPSPSYPDQALGSKVDGDVVFIARVTEQGMVESVRIVEVPGEALGFEEAVREAVMQWRFDAAVNDGQPIPSTYAGRVYFASLLPYQHARMYGQSSHVVWEEAQAVVQALGRTQESTDAASQILVTQWSRFDSADFGQPPAGLSEFQLHVFVSPFVEPARVHVGSVSLGRDSVRYNLGVAERWFFERLERRLSEVGQVVPVNSDMHRTAASSLLNEPDPCVGQSPDASLLAPPTRLTAVMPIVSGTATDIQTAAIFDVEVEASLDGSVVSSRVLGAINNSRDRERAAAAAGAVSLWRYSPSVWEGCAVPFTGIAEVSFQEADDNPQASVTEQADSEQVTGLDVVVLVDRSAGTIMDQQLQTIQQATIALLRQLEPGDRVELITFGSRVNRVEPSTDNLLHLEEAVLELTPGGGTVFYDALHTVLTSLAAVGETNRTAQTALRPQTVVVLSDGQDTSSLTTFDEVLGLARQSDASIYSIVIQPGARPGFREATSALQRLSEETGGRAFLPKAREIDIEEAVSQLSETLATIRP